jgi:hypothetical protein
VRTAGADRHDTPAGWATLAVMRSPDLPPEPDVDDAFAEIVSHLDAPPPYRPLWVAVVAAVLGMVVVFAFGRHLVLGAIGFLLVAGAGAWVADRVRDRSVALLARYRRYYTRMTE